jgi:hypothetical protein
MTLLLSRKIIMREYDFIKELQPVPMKSGGHYSLYDRAYFTPITKDGLEKEYLIHVLTEKVSGDSWKPTHTPAKYLYDMKKRLYSESYVKWQFRFCDDGYIWIRYNKNTPETKLGWGIFEMDIKTKYP